MLEPFDLGGPVPGCGLTVLEASAGTGKTYTLTSLVVKFVAAGVPLSQILAVTFTRTATGELRDRIRERMVEVHQQLASGCVSAADPVATVLGSAPSAEVASSVTRLADALSEFDSATIATTHGFCQMVLSELGSAGDTAPDSVLIEDPTDLVHDVADDLYLRWALGRPVLPFSPEVARRAAIEATRNPGVRVVPDAGGEPSALLARLARAARGEVSRRLLDDNLLTYDNLLYRLSQTLSDPERGAPASERLRRRYRVVLVDEFQDTDPSQWQILRQAFGGDENVLVLIGDPKQAIYGFRGADVYSYLEAARAASSRYTLADNWRADRTLLLATDALLSPLQFGHEGIVYRPVRAAADRHSPGVVGQPHPSPLRFRVVADRQIGVRITSRGQLQKGSLTEWLAGDVAADIAELLGSDAELRSDGASLRRLAAGDVAVLTRTNRQALQVREALRSVGVPAVVAGLDSVFGSGAARDWLRLLEALQEPASRSRAAAVAMTSFIGMTAADVATAGEERWESVHDRINSWAGVLATGGVAALYRSVADEQGLQARVLAQEGGERTLTDLGHVAQLLHTEATSAQLTAPSLRAWLEARTAAASQEQNEAEERSRRLESDAEAVQILTIHRAKGLEFPVVYCPFLWDAGKAESRSASILFHDPTAGEARTLDVGCPDGDVTGRARYERHAALCRSERRGEDLRLLYVALTRARHQLVVWWAAARDSRMSPLARLLVCRDHGSGAVTGVPPKEPTARQVTAILGDLAARAPGLVSVEMPGDRSGARAALPPPTPRDTAGLRAAKFERTLDRRWRRSSYSSITSGAHDAGFTAAVSSEPEDPLPGDEPTGAPVRPGPTLTDAGTRTGREAGQLSPMSDLPGGTDTGTFIHRVLERADFAADDLEVHLNSVVQEVAARFIPPGDISPVVPGLLSVLATPLGPMLPDMSLTRVARSDRLDEMTFEMPLVGGDRPRGEVRTEDVALLLARHLPGGGPLSGYARSLSDPLLAGVLRGYLTGSLDLVFRTRRTDGESRWFLADYKTNWLGGSGRPLTLGDYRPSALDAEMQRRHYPLQALLYMVALHRYLRWRQPGYDPDRHLGGILYLFLRGMAGPATPWIDGHPCGVFSWRPPPALVVGLSDLFHRGALS